MAGAAVGDANATAVEGPTVDTTVERVSGTGVLRYDVSLSGLSEYERVELVVGRDATVLETDGTTATQRHGRTWLQVGGQRGEATVRIRTTTAVADRPTDGGEYVAADSWLLGRVPLVELRWAGAGGPVERRRLFDDVRGTSEQVTAGERYALVGTQRRTTVDTADGNVRLVRPAGTTLRPDEDALAAALGDAADRLDVGDRGDEVVLFALGSPARRGGESFPVQDEAWINADSRLDDPNSVWLHEYVHTRQDFRLAADMRWFREASAEYYAARLAYEQGRIDRAAMETHLTGTPKAAALTAPGTWTDPHVPYTKGARVLALVDRKIRLSTDGDRSLEDVFRRLNAHEGPVTYTDFADAVAAVAGHRMDGWLDRYVDGTAPVAGFYPGGPERQGVLAPLVQVLDGAGAGAVFLALAVLLSGVGSVPLYRYLDRVESDGRDERPGRPV
ncbi:hypothetical protein [Halorientalis pallida]|uniref:Peptidase MA superfamily protein n=1 Tax=Halorientalis pallida TaxID=2479928 RepID=A0A498KTN2_9EURY|nr:hypothetical protein [Halorientalis pallida]RXK46640.1 hypothetical protein EAF64_18355 [Halorientalis pallida]